MAAYYFDHSAAGVLDALLQAIKDGAASGEVHLLSNYTQGMDYATAITGNTLGFAAITSADFSAIGVLNTYDRKMTFNGKSGTASATDAAPTDLHIAITNGSDTILCVTDETSDQPITIGNTLNFPAFDLNSLQPTLAP